MIHTLHPLTITEKLTQTADFYKTYFDFSEVFTSDWYIQLAHKNGAEIALMIPGVPDQPAFLQKAYNGTGMVFTFETKDATKVFEELTAKNAPIAYTLKDEKWGQRHFMLKDPSGVYVDVVQYL
jgi:uncharacterized glyoxalase superfamily protein PhnB